MSDYDPKLLQPDQRFGELTPQQQKKQGCARLALIGCAGVTLLFLGFFAVIFLGMIGMMRSSEPYIAAIRKANESPLAKQALGSPIEAVRFPSGSLSADGESKRAELNIPVSGPKGKGKLEVRAVKAGKDWTYHRMVLVVGEGEAEIDLLAESQPPAGTDF